MQDSESGSDQRPPGEAVPAGQAVQPEKAIHAEDQTAPPRTRAQRSGRIATYAAAVALVAGLGFGGFAAAGGLSRPVAASAAIPVPPRSNALFVEDDDGTGADNQENILQSTAPGLVHVNTSRGVPAGVGVILTPSGIVLTSGQNIPGAGQVSVRTVLSGQAFTARVIGSDRAEGLALLQIEGGPVFKPVAVGNSRDFAVGAAVTAVGSSGITRTFTLDLGNLATRNGAAAVGGRELTGLFAASLQVLPGQETGGPLVNLSGQVIAIDVAGAGSGLHSTGFAVPINQALAVARQLDRQS